MFLCEKYVVFLVGVWRNAKFLLVRFEVLCAVVKWSYHVEADVLEVSLVKVYKRLLV